MSATPSSGLCTLCLTPPIRGARGGTLRRGPDEGSHRHEHIFLDFSEISVNVATVRLILSGEHAGAIIYEIRVREPCSPGVLHQ